MTKNSFSYPSEILYSKSAKTLFLQGKTRFWKTKFYILSRLQRADTINHSELWFSNIMHSITILFHWRRSMVISHKTKKFLTLLWENDFLTEKIVETLKTPKIMFLVTGGTPKTRRRREKIWGKRAKIGKSAPQARKKIGKSAPQARKK